jgi:hypothetical protein
MPCPIPQRHPHRTQHKFVQGADDFTYCLQFSDSAPTRPWGGFVYSCPLRGLKTNKPCSGPETSNSHAAFHNRELESRAPLPACSSVDGHSRSQNYAVGPDIIEGS